LRHFRADAGGADADRGRPHRRRSLWRGNLAGSRTPADGAAKPARAAAALRPGRRRSAASSGRSQRRAGLLRAAQGTESGLICCYRVGAERISASLFTFQLASFLLSLMLLGRGGLVGRRQGLTGRLGGSLKGGAARSLLKANLRTSAMFCAPWPLRTRDRSSWKVTSSVQCSVFSIAQWPRMFCASPATERALDVM